MKIPDIECPFCHVKELSQFKLLGGADDPEGNPNYAFNVWECECDAICKQNVWSNPGEYWINPLTTEFIWKSYNEDT